MTQPRIYSILETLSKKEWGPLLAFVRGQTSEGSDSYKVLLFIKKNWRNRPSISTIHSCVMPSSTRKNVLNRLYQVRKNIQDFLVWQNIVMSENQKDLLLFESFIDRGIYDEAQKIFTELRDRLVIRTEFSQEASFYLHRIYYKMFFSHAPYDRTHGKEVLNRIIDYLRDYQSLVEEMTTISYSYMAQLLPEWDHLKDMPYLSKSLFLKEMSSDLNTFLRDRENNIVTNELLQKHREIPEDFVNSDILELYYSIYFFTLRQRVIENKDYDKIFLIRELYEHGLIRGTFVKNNQILSSTILNIVDLAHALRDDQWHQKIIITHNNLIKKEHRRDIQKVSNAISFLIQEQYEDALSLFNPLQYSRVAGLERMVRFYKAICFYEMRRYKELDTHLKAFSTYIRRQRDKVSDKRIMGTFHFINLTRKLMEDAPLHVLENGFSTDEYIYKGMWLSEKIEEKRI